MAQRIPQLDGVRGIAILLVLVHNLKAFTFPPLSYLTTYGWMGVDLFFVLSGFLITGILLDSKPSEKYFKNFYVRRCLRIWPLYYAVLLSIFVFLPLVWHQQAHDIFQRAHPWWSYFFYLQNFLLADPLGGFGPLGVTWSLSVEELFYLVWPLVVRFLGTSQLRWVAWAIILASPVLRLFLSMRHVLIYSNPFCRLDGMMAGALLALYVRKSGIRPARFVNHAWAMLAGALVLAIASEQLSFRWLTFSMAVAMFAALVFLALFSPSAWLRTVLTGRFLVFTGTISYGLYLLHKFPYDFLKALRFQLHPTVTFLLAVPGAYLLAILSWNLLERPFLKLKTLFEDAPAKTPAVLETHLQSRSEAS